MDIREIIKNGIIAAVVSQCVKPFRELGEGIYCCCGMIYYGVKEQFNKKEKC